MSTRLPHMACDVLTCPQILSVHCLSAAIPYCHQCSICLDGTALRVIYTRQSTYVWRAAPLSCPRTILDELSDRRRVSPHHDNASERDWHCSVLDPDQRARDTPSTIYQLFMEITSSFQSASIRSGCRRPRMFVTS